MIEGVALALESEITTSQIRRKDEGHNGGGIAEKTAEAELMPRFEDGSVNLQELVRRLAEDVANAIMAAEAERLCGETGNSRNGYRERELKTCVGTLTLKVPKLRRGSFFLEDVIERYQRVDRALAGCVAEMYATGTSTRKVAKVAEKMGVAKLSKDQVSTLARSIDADVEELTVFRQAPVSLKIIGRFSRHH